MKKIVLVAGGTGGHIVPAAFLCRVLSGRGYKCVLYTDRYFLPYEARFPDIRRYVLPLCKRSGGIVQLLKFCVLLAYSCVLSYTKLRSLKPDLVIGFGAYPSFPVLLAAWVMSANVVLHEQNSVMGRVNRMFAGYAKIIACGMPLRQIGNKLVHKAVYVGVPTDIKQAVKQTSEGSSINLVILGGSQGLCTFGKIFALAIAELPAHIRSRVFVTQQCGKGQLEAITELYTAHRIKHRLGRFFTDMEDIMGAADLIISRAGATTIAEIMAAGKPAIYVPYERSSCNHQLHNARLVEDLGAGLCVEERTLDVAAVRDMLAGLLNDQNGLQEMSCNAARHAIPDAGAQFCAVVDELLKG
ncbi:UDP-N-acetylglucosamine--N-acetylmuramyl-(pentapeptide)pyrophosphoryl-undecaprenol N-acetylglucosamine transferase [Anaplasma centrale str. Israel]|uniref:UDP-N-acetylglucosamine--N-acetylmuramyl-(pentapeptide) pyrophosphoryl-undecaprenol N-acetylglucosamine transferase n=1 Tax=Anaplasma centrale (strain Israel) TaxID=574556 RepID=D1ASB4_ANACI|nr:UDP-N-acetylglucosamine--N-acetylmuramyl-(pentapeptide) pyrophosphoryl-undecaprenol N-acetylglucosamine transferase [Anaplasma centrale]ACZ49367.1 UDP-N-acetylglucosamine--N-acetylmuramyl-(pentapeptide)pyrophosphoryl-undecaprenol N-acetylglucosamine transferase [Anaplasma centrale str. Israel]